MARSIWPLLMVSFACSTAAGPDPAVSPPSPPPPSEPPMTADKPPAVTPAQAPPDEPEGAQPEPPVTAQPEGWTDAGGGLAVRLELPAAPAAIGKRIEVRLHFRNNGATPLRIYMIQSETFRALQSDLQVFGADGSLLSSQPDPHPHGYVVGERDFPEIAAGGEQVHVQTLSLQGKDFAGATGPLALRWTYRNRVGSWEGGIKTLDGPTKALFGGGPIPGIWRGEVTVEAGLPLKR